MLDLHISLQSFDILNPQFTNPSVQFVGLVELKFSSFSPANFSDHYLAYYLALGKNIHVVALERKMNHALSSRMFPVFNVTMELAFANKSIHSFAIVALLVFAFVNKNRFAFAEILSQYLECKLYTGDSD